MQSLNFPTINELPLLGIFASDAEKNLSQRPDISLFRTRQLLELLLYELADRHGLLGQAFQTCKLFEKINTLSQQRIISTYEWKNAFHRIRIDANQAVHPGPYPHEPSYWYTKASDALLLMAKAWANFLHTEEPKRLRKPPAANDICKQQIHFQEVIDQLNGIEQLVELHRKYDEAERALATFAQGLSVASLKHSQQLYAKIRSKSIVAAMLAHQGKTTAADEDLIEESLQVGTPLLFEEVVLYKNRLAVFHLNKLDLQTTIDELEPLIEWESSNYEFIPARYATLPIAKRNLGALYGTLGQAQAMMGFSLKDKSLIDKGIASFHQAHQCFADQADRKRQLIYHLHAITDKQRLGMTVSAEEKQLCLDFAQSAPFDAFDKFEWSPDLFSIALAIKIAYVFQMRPQWKTLNRLVSLIPHNEPLSHPFEQIVGGYLLLQKERASTRKKRVNNLRLTAKLNNIVGFIARCYLAEIFNSPEDITVPPSIQSWYQKMDMNTRLENEGAFSMLPFNYA